MYTECLSNLGKLGLGGKCVGTPRQAGGRVWCEGNLTEGGWGTVEPNLLGATVALPPGGNDSWVEGCGPPTVGGPLWLALWAAAFDLLVTNMHTEQDL